MESLTGLWDSGVLGGLFTTLVTVFGQLSAINSQKFSLILSSLRQQQASDCAAHESAFARSGDGGTAVRRLMLFMAFGILGICPFLFAFFPNIPVAVETAQQSGGWLWGLIPEKESFGVSYVNGFYIADVWKELMANMVSAYIGAGITRRAFGIGK